jgi:phosphoserine aminotransferase
MISFYPGPSRVYDEIPKYVQDAHKKGILSINHRSDEFIKISKKTITLLKEKLDIPKDYTIFFTSSATECWEIIAQSFISKRSYHIFNGAFGKKWHEYTKRICSGARDYPFTQDESLNPSKYRFGTGDGVVCVTQNETSNGTQITNEVIHQIKQNNPSHLLAVDATSSMGGIALNFSAADIWFASVQKCFGLPAGLALLICSPQAIARAKEINDTTHYNNVVFMNEMMEKWQTPYTPNVLNIYLLMRVMEKRKHISEIEKKVIKRYRLWNDFFRKHGSLKHLIGDQSLHSYTVVPISASADVIQEVKQKAKAKGILLGEGYGDLKASTFRIANFPAIKKAEIEKLKHLLQKEIRLSV